MSYLDFKKDLNEMKFFDFLDKWETNSKYDEYNQKNYDEDFYEYICEEYDYNEKKINEWKVFKNTCEIYVNLLNNQNI